MAKSLKGAGRLAASACTAALLAAGVPSGATAQAVTVTNLVSDGSVPAATVDPLLINPWGMSFSPGGPFWISNNNSGSSTLYDGAGAKIPLNVTIPLGGGASGAGTPTGQVFAAIHGKFRIGNGSKKRAADFLFDTEDGTISGWQPGINPTQAVIAVDNSAQLAVYKGLAIGTTGKRTYLYAANFRAGDIEVYNEHFQMVKTFTDSTVPAGYAPFNVQNLGGALYVTFAKQNKQKHDDVPGAGFGFVDAFSLKGAFLRRVASHGPLNAPWGLDIAPASFGAFAGDLLVGNFGDGWVNAFDPATGAYKGPLTDSGGAPIAIPGLWGLITGNGGQGGDANLVYFTAGLQGEAHGLFGSLTPSSGSKTSGQ